MSPQESLIDTLRQMATGFARTQELYTAVKLGIADHLASGPKKSSELAQAVNAHPQALYRFMRKMVVHNLLSQEEDGSFRLLPMGEYLRTDHSDSLHNLILYIGELHYSADRGLLHAVQTGKPAFDHVFGMPFFDYLMQNPHLGVLFNNIMRNGIDDRITAVVSTYDFSQAHTIIDVGGGNGALIFAILCNNQRARGIIFDLPSVVTEAQYNLNINGLAERCSAVAGNFLHDAIPKDGDIYIMSQIIHDWDDEKAAHILSNCRDAMHSNSRILIIETLMPERVDEAPATVGSDISMLKLTGGCERTSMEYQTMLTKAGLQLTNIITFEPNKIYLGRKSSWVIIECKSCNK